MDEEIKLPANTVVFMGSDGLEDQNNRERKKFGRKRLKYLLTEIAHLSSAKQQLRIEEELDKFMSGVEQRDDILWIGFRV